MGLPREQRPARQPVAHGQGRVATSGFPRQL